jgi:hypothetical protein
MNIYSDANLSRPQSSICNLSLLGADVSSCSLGQVFSDRPEAVLIRLIVHTELQSLRAHKPEVALLDQYIPSVLVACVSCLSLCYRIRCLKPAVVERKFSNYYLTTYFRFLSPLSVDVLCGQLVFL